VLESYRALATAETGFDDERVLTMATWLPVPNDPSAGQYADPKRRVDFFDHVLDELTSQGDVAEAAATSLLPLGGTFSVPISRAGPPGAPSHTPTLAEYRLVTESYFQVMGIEVLAGRAFRRTDEPGAAQVAVVSRTFAARRLRGEDPIGQRVCIGPTTAKCMDVVGVVADVPHSRLGEPPSEAVYANLRQNGQSAVAMAFVLKTIAPAGAHMTEAVGALHRVDPGIPAFSVRPMADILKNARAKERVLSLLFGVISVVTGLLAAVGIYGVVSSAVERRHLEIGIRLSLGGARAGVLGLLVREGLWSGMRGVRLGMFAALGFGRLMVTFLPEVEAVDSGILVGAVVLGTSIVAAACVVPALRATGINPAEAVRAD
jgi:ABC-type antimicrobial peptide transport system permease subunit